MGKQDLSRQAGMSLFVAFEPTGIFLALAIIF
jgi:hypothetical protein